MSSASPGVGAREDVMHVGLRHELAQPTLMPRPEPPSCDSYGWGAYVEFGRAAADAARARHPGGAARRINERLE
jgi:hypothetical protein